MMITPWRGGKKRKKGAAGAPIRWAGLEGTLGRLGGSPVPWKGRGTIDVKIICTSRTPLEP